MSVAEGDSVLVRPIISALLVVYSVRTPISIFCARIGARESLKKSVRVAAKAGLFSAECVQQLGQLVRIHRLHQMVIEARVAGTFAIRILAPSGDRDQQGCVAVR